MYRCVIVGAGMAGMSCALKLKESGVPYAIVSPNIGGRVCYLPQYEMNFGAVFTMRGYKYARKILTPSAPVLPSYLDLECHKVPGRGYGVLSSAIVGAVPELLHFMNYLVKTFKPHYEKFKLACEQHEMREAIAADRYIAELFLLSADQLIEREKFPKAADVLVSQFVHACTGTSIHLLNALDYLNCAMGLIDTAERFTFDSNAMQEQLEAGDVLIDSVTSVEKLEGGWRVRTAGGRELEAENLVMASPADVTRDLIAPIVGKYRIRRASELHAYKVAGTIRPAYAAHALHLFDESIPLINIGTRPDGAYEVFTCKPMSMDAFFFDGYEVLHVQDWPRALFTNPSIILDQCLGDGLYRAGDHNALGLEPAAISGVFVANKILEG